MATLYDEFQRFVQDLSTTTTNLEILEEKAKYFEHVRVKNLDHDTTYYQLSSVIIQCLLDRHSKKMFNKIVLGQILDILSVQSSGAVSMIQRANIMCLLAMVKSDFTSEQLNSAIFLTKQNKFMDIHTSADLVPWQELCEYVFTHNQINQLVQELIRDATGMPVNNVHQNISINFVHSLIDGLRGYTGINCIYINALYVKNRHLVYKMGSNLGDELNDIVLKMNLFSIALHEFSHARLRQFLDDPNTSSPVVLVNNLALVVTHGGLPEFGRMCECRLFGEQLDFWNTQRQGQWTDSHSTYFTTFIDAIKMNKYLPPFDINKTRCATRSSRCTIGSDMDTEVLEIC